MNSTLSGPVVTKKKTPKNGGSSDNMDARIVLLASEDWSERVSAAAKSLGLSVAAFIRMACEEKMRRLDGQPSGD